MDRRYRDSRRRRTANHRPPQAGYSGRNPSGSDMSRRTFIGLAAVAAGTAAGFGIHGLLAPGDVAADTAQAAETVVDVPASASATSTSTASTSTAQTATGTKRHLSDRGTAAPAGSYLQTEWIAQAPELPTGCEVTAATMMLNHYGFGADKLELDGYLTQTGSIDTWYEHGVRYGPDPDEAFIGDTRTEEGWYCTPRPIVAALSDYLADCGSKGYTPKDISGCPVDDLYAHIDDGTPVTVWVTIGLADHTVDDSWVSETDGSTVNLSTVDHAMTLLGYDAQNVVLADPLDDIVTYRRSTFEKVFEQRGNMAVILAG